ncbi:hypothetical protein OV079_52125 [Nannocystis pusilla]|uniref:Uncharacterized protein n=1 Tax=Nannocystis pusilla TaxID=889268 RepID=A0A9X3F292_9BACT|nr:hypothetical protein [Nannocystis pusilla]MCY1013940.1 hypothetical protein [Nannocystis pusilla]
MVLRICVSAALGFAALHKLNTDFLAPATSCADLAGRLGQFWAVPAPPLRRGPSSPSKPWPSRCCGSTRASACRGPSPWSPASATSGPPPSTP